MDKIFSKFIEVREEEADTPAIISKIKLQKGSREFAPFTINKNSHANLRYIVQAFLDSPNIGVGYTTIDKSKGEIEPQLKKKSLYLTGGAVRDHLLGKTPRNYDLVTDATASEIEMILSKSKDGFIKTQPRVTPPPQKIKEYRNLPNPDDRNRIFYPCRWDRKGKELEICVEINEEKFYLATLSKTPKSRYASPHEGQAAKSIEEDAENRDFTVNALYIPLTNVDGDNIDLLDPVGGAHDIKKNAMVPVKDGLEARLQEDPHTAFRYAKFNSRFNKNQNIPRKHQELISQYTDPSQFNHDVSKSEYVSGLEHPDSNPRNFIKNLGSTNLLGIVFPNLNFSTDDVPVNFKGDRWLATAWILRNNDPYDVKHILSNTGWSTQEASDIAHLIKMYQNSSNLNSAMTMGSGCLQPGITRGKIRDWIKITGMNDNPYDFY